MLPLEFCKPSSNLQIVQAVDGLLMATQEDIPWRETLFDGWHFYDLSQCLEFRRKGYDVAVPFQISHWCIHDCGIVKLSNEYEKYRVRFLKEYEKDIN